MYWKGRFRSSHATTNYTVRFYYQVPAYHVVPLFSSGSIRVLRCDMSTRHVVYKLCSLEKAAKLQTVRCVIYTCILSTQNTSHEAHEDGNRGKLHLREVPYLREGLLPFSSFLLLFKQ